MTIQYLQLFKGGGGGGYYTTIVGNMATTMRIISMVVYLCSCNYTEFSTKVAEIMVITYGCEQTLGATFIIQLIATSK